MELEKGTRLYSKGLESINFFLESFFSPSSLSLSPCGSKSTSPLCWFHLSSAAATNRSTTACALLEKSPNWASHKTSARPAAPSEKPYSNASVAPSLSGEFQTSTRSCRAPLLLGGGRTPGRLTARRRAGEGGGEEEESDEYPSVFSPLITAAAASSSSCSSISSSSTQRRPVSASRRTACRWLKVPRSTSWPERRIA